MHETYFSKPKEIVENVNLRVTQRIMVELQVHPSYRYNNHIELKRDISNNYL